MKSRVNLVNALHLVLSRGRQTTSDRININAKLLQTN